MQLDFAVGFHRGKKMRPLPLFAIIESPSALLRLQEICLCGVQSLGNVRLDVVVFGSDDFLACLGNCVTLEWSTTRLCIASNKSGCVLVM